MNLYNIVQCVSPDGSGAFYMVGTYYGTLAGCITTLLAQQLQMGVPAKATYLVLGVVTTILPS